MRMPPLPPRRPALDLPRGERLLAWAPLRPDTAADTPADGPAAVADAVGGTRAALYLPQRLPWEQVAAADWDSDEGVLTVVEVGRFGQVRPVHRLALDDAGRLLQLVRERVTASIALQRHVGITDAAGVRVLARRAPDGRGELAWFVEYDDAVDPTDPSVDLVVQDALARARGDLGE